jgi:hypothetical protein
VRLGALRSAPSEPEDTGKLLARFYALDAVGVLAPEDAAQTLLEAGRFFLGFRGLAQAETILSQIVALGDEERAAELSAAIESKAADHGVGG